MAIDPQQPIGELVIAHPETADVFERFRLDYCCGGKLTLQSACQKQNCDLGQVVEALTDRLAQPRNCNEPDWSQRSLSELCDNLEQMHHRFVRDELALIDAELKKVVARHSAEHPGLKQVAAVVAQLQQELLAHLVKEERVLFPLVRHLESTGTMPAFACGTLQAPIDVMEHEHDHSGEALRQIRELTDDFLPPGDACPTYRSLLARLERFERDLHRHVHKENSILFPRALALQNQLHNKSCFES